MKPLLEYTITESQVYKFMTPIIITRKKNIHVYIQKANQNTVNSMLFQGIKLHGQILHQATHKRKVIPEDT